MTTASNPSANSSAAIRILVVDDIEDNLSTMQALLARPGLTVLLANSAAAALELMDKNELALALLDVRMPQIDGFQLAERIRSNDRTRNIPIIFLTGDGADQSRTFEGYAAGAVDFLIKPVDPRVLESKVRVFVELAQQRRELCERNVELERLVQLQEKMTEALRKAHGQAVHEAHTDALTEVSNRRHIMELADAALNDRRRQSQPVSLAILDLDHFKAVNDTYGHIVGDTVLIAFCTHVNQQIRTSHMLGRLGGEEFLLLMPGMFADEAEVVLKRVQLTMKPHAGVEYTFSAGVTQAGAGEPLLDVIKRADTALYEAKRAGRDCSVTSPAPLADF